MCSSSASTHMMCVDGFSPGNSVVKAAKFGPVASSLIELWTMSSSFDRV
jgi:hypothetical protein